VRCTIKSKKSAARPTFSRLGAHRPRALRASLCALRSLSPGLASGWHTVVDLLLLALVAWPSLRLAYCGDLLFFGPCSATRGNRASPSGLVFCRVPVRCPRVPQADAALAAPTLHRAPGLVFYCPWRQVCQSRMSGEAGWSPRSAPVVRSVM